jgi:hypothetical protein
VTNLDVFALCRSCTVAGHTGMAWHESRLGCRFTRYEVLTGVTEDYVVFWGVFRRPRDYVSSECG